jgi:small-conductance mechanosensitive channel
MAEDQRKLTESLNELRQKDLPQLGVSAGKTESSVTLSWAVIMVLVTLFLGASGWAAISNSGVSRELGETAIKIQKAEESLGKAEGQLKTLSEQTKATNQSVQQQTKAVEKIRTTLDQVTTELADVTTDMKKASESLTKVAARLENLERPADGQLQSIAIRLKLDSKALASTEGISDGYVLKLSLPLLASIEPNSIRRIDVQLELPDDLKEQVGQTATRGKVTEIGKLDVEIVATNAAKASLIQAALEKGLVAVANIVVAADPPKPAT